MNSNGNKLPDYDGKVWTKWLRATGVDHGDGYRVPEGVWDAVRNGNWPDDENTIRWILEEYLDLETAKANGYLQLVIALREQAEVALNVARHSFEQSRQIKIEADIDEVIKTIKGLGFKSHEETTARHSCREKTSRRRNSWMRSMVMSTTAFVVGVFAGVIGAYQLPPSVATTIRLGRSPEIRRAIPVEAEIRRAIPVEPEIRRAIPVQNAHNSAVRMRR